MGELYRKYVRERFLDLIDWVDIRPDLNLSWCLTLVVAIGALSFALPPGMIYIAAFFGIAATLLVIVGGAVVAAVWVAWYALADAWAGWKRERLSKPEFTGLRTLLD